MTASRSVGNVGPRKEYRHVQKLRPKIKPNFFVADQFGFEGKLVLLQTGFQQKSQKKQLED